MSLHESFSLTKESGIICRDSYNSEIHFFLPVVENVAYSVKLCNTWLASN